MNDNPETVTVARADLQVALDRLQPHPQGTGDESMAILRLNASSQYVPHNTPAGGRNSCGIVIEDNQDPDCFSIRQDNHDDSEDLIHFCDWPALKAAIDKHQSERGGKV